MHEMIAFDQIRPRLERLGLTPTAFARKIGVYHTTLARLMTGDTAVSYDTVLKVNKVLPEIEIELRDYLLELHPLDRTPPVQHLVGSEAAE